MGDKNNTSSNLFPTFFLIISVILIITIGYFSSSSHNDKDHRSKEVTASVLSANLL